jgi:hypothetical protein
MMGGPSPYNGETLMFTEKNASLEPFLFTKLCTCRPSFGIIQLTPTLCLALNENTPTTELSRLASPAGPIFFIKKLDLR